MQLDNDRVRLIFVHTWLFILFMLGSSLFCFIFYCLPLILVSPQLLTEFCVDTHLFCFFSGKCNLEQRWQLVSSLTQNAAHKWCLSIWSRWSTSYAKRYTVFMKRFICFPDYLLLCWNKKKMWVQWLWVQKVFKDPRRITQKLARYLLGKVWVIIFRTAFFCPTFVIYM